MFSFLPAIFSLLNLCQGKQKPNSLKIPVTEQGNYNG